MLDKTPGDAILSNLKWRGPLRIADLAQRLKVTHEAVRTQMASLADSGLVQATRQAGGVGRPARYWTLTEAGDRRFPDTHADVTVQIIDAIRATGGETMLETIIAAREAAVTREYAAEMSGISTLRERVARLAELRDREGYMAECRETPEGFVLIENHCPICAAAQACQGFCRSEMDMFRAILEPVGTVQRIDHIIAGARRCAYAIRP